MPARPFSMRGARPSRFAISGVAGWRGLVNSTPLCQLYFMKIHAKVVGPETYSISFGETEIILQGGEIKTLLMQLMQVMAPGGDAVGKQDGRRLEFLNHIKTANDVGIQKLLLVADHHDLLALLKSTEGETAIHDKFFDNMSANNAKMFNEDLSYEFRDGLPDKDRREALDRLIKLTRKLELDGDLVFEKPGRSE